jgi:hypothetical protein
MAQRTIRIFLSTPSDVEDERDALGALVSEINDVVTFLAPERNVRLELVHYQTHTYPDIGSPQQVIDRLIPVDYDIHFGIMWKRCGTPTETEDSGTVHEFNRALAHREKTGRPTIMFYFGMENVDMPTTTGEIEQLTRVISFRERLQTIGLTATYPKRAEFRERARIGLLRAIADILREELPSRASQQSPAVTADIPDRLREMCDHYDDIRNDMPAGLARTRSMTAILEEMKTHAPNGQASLQQLKESGSAGYRLAAVAVLQVFPSAKELPWLANRLNPETEKPFVGYQAAVALLQAVRSLPKSDCETLQTEIERALDLALLNPNDPPRITALDYALKELTLKCG